MEKLFIVDALNFLFRSYYAIGPMSTPSGEATGALFGFIRSIQKINTDFSPKHLVIVFDGPDNKKSRTALFADYKSHRTKMPEDLFSQVEKAMQWCDLAGIPTLSVPGVEADDIIGSVAVWACHEKAQVVICSSDKDLCQLINEDIHVLNPHKDNLLIDASKVEELFGVRPEQIVDYLAIVGDASDNIPGIEGFGPKTAVSLLHQFKTLDALLAHPEKVAGEKKQQTLKASKEIALLSRQLATIQTDLDFPKEKDFFSLKPPQQEELKKFYHDHHFLSLLKSLETAQDTIATTYILVNNEDQLEDVVQSLSQEKEVCLDTETTDIRPMQARLVGIGFSAHEGKAWYIPLNGEIAKPIFHEKVSRILKNSHFYGHHLKYDLHILANEGFTLPSICFDTMLASYLLNPQSQRHNLDVLALEKFHKVKIDIKSLLGKGKTTRSMEEVPLDQVSNYCGEDVDYTVRLKELFSKELKSLDLLPILEEIELPLIPVLLKMERRGIFVDKAKLHALSKELTSQIETLQTEIYAMAGEELNLNSPKQLSTVLFEKLGIPAPKKTATGFSTSADVLEQLQDRYPIIQKILHYRTLEKLRSTYVDSLPDEIHPETQRIHCSFNQSVAATGRLSCQNPNLQNIPIRTVEGRKIREAFRPEKDDWVFLSGDYSQIELRLLAHLSEDPALLSAFNAGEDIHRYTASLVFNVPLKEVTDEMRHHAKAVNFGILYGQQAFGLSQGLNIGYAEAAQFIDTYFQRYKRVKEYLESCKESARKTGKAVTLMGRQRPIPEIQSSNPMVRAAAERLAINTPLQGTAADLIKMAMIQIDEDLTQSPQRAFMLLQIHDELLFETHASHVSWLEKQVKNRMESVFQLKVPLEVHISIGKNWEEC